MNSKESKESKESILKGLEQLSYEHCELNSQLMTLEDLIENTLKSSIISIMKSSGPELLCSLNISSWDEFSNSPRDADDKNSTVFAIVKHLLIQTEGVKKNVAKLTDKIKSITSSVEL